jgi:hypothetical protein
VKRRRDPRARGPRRVLRFRSKSYTDVVQSRLLDTGYRAPRIDDLTIETNAPQDEIDQAKVWAEKYAPARDSGAHRDPETAKIDRLLAKLSQAGKDYLDEYMRAPRRADVIAAWKRVPVREHRIVDYLLDGIRPGYEEVDSAVAHLYED